jgi:lysophospholipase L1-like esterase
VGGKEFFVSHPGDGAWHEMKVQHTFSYSSTDRSVDVVVYHGNGPREALHIAGLSLAGDEPQAVYQYYFVEETARPIMANLESLLEHLEGYQKRTGAEVTVVVSPHVQDPEHPVFQPAWLMEQFTARTRAFAEDHGFRFLDARALLPNRTYGRHSNSPVIDGVHFDAEGHKILAHAIVELLDL